MEFFEFWRVIGSDFMCRAMKQKTLGVINLFPLAIKTVTFSIARFFSFSFCVFSNLNSFTTDHLRIKIQRLCVCKMFPKIFGNPQLQHGFLNSNLVT